MCSTNLPLPHLAAMLKNSSAFLGNDSGITHLPPDGDPHCRRLRPTDPAVWAPRGPRVRIMTAEEILLPLLLRERQDASRQCLEKIEP